MKNIKYIYILILLSTIIFNSCNEANNTNEEIEWSDLPKFTISEYVGTDSLSDQYSMFDTILKVGNLKGTLGAYNPNGDDYTLFLPTNEAIELFISENNDYTTFDDLLNDNEYCAEMARFHAVNGGIKTNDFPFGALPELNLAYQYLTVGYEDGNYLINGEAPVVDGNIEASNGWIHIISKALSPVNYTTTDWLEENPDYSIFAEAIKLTGFDETLSRVVRLDTISEIAVTLFVEPDSIFNKYNIYSITDLIETVSPDNSEYTESYNPLYDFVGYHILSGNYYLDDFEEVSTNYSTYGSYPIKVNGTGTDLEINPTNAESAYDTIVNASNDTTFVTYITFLYDYSNISTQSGTVHMIDYMMYPKAVSAADVYLQFYEEALFDLYREEGGTFLIEDKSLLETLTWTGADNQLYFVYTEDETFPVWDNDYIFLTGDFTITYTTPKIVQGDYTMFLRAYAYGSDNAIVEVYLDGIKIGGLVDLTTASSDESFPSIELGEIEFLEYESHTITIESIIPGDFYWDATVFEP